MKKFILTLVVLLAFVIPASASAALIQTGYLRGYGGAALQYPTWGRIYIRDNVTGAVGSTYTKGPDAYWIFGNVVNGRSYTYWGIYTPACVRYYTAKFTRTAWDNSFTGIGAWSVGSINLEGGTYVC